MNVLWVIEAKPHKSGLSERCKPKKENKKGRDNGRKEDRNIEALEIFWPSAVYGPYRIPLLSPLPSHPHYFHPSSTASPLRLSQSIIPTTYCHPTNFNFFVVHFMLLYTSTRWCEESITTITDCTRSLATTAWKQGVSSAFLCSLVTSYRRNDLHQRPTPTSNESADLLRTQRINFSYANMHALGWRATRLSFDASFLENPCEYLHELYTTRN